MKEKGKENYIEDVGLIEKGLRHRIEKLADEESKRPRKIVSEAFKRGFASYATGDEKIPRIDEDNLVEDSLSYKSWQLNIFDDISKEYPGIQWAEVKSAFLERGLERIG